MYVFDEVVLGGGWAGLLYSRQSLSRNAATKPRLGVIEKDKKDELGGLLKSKVIDGFTFDTGGPHILFSKDKQVLSDIVSMLNGNSVMRKRNNFVLYHNKLINYPFENGIYALEPEVRVQFIKDIIKQMISLAKNDEWTPSTFLDWIKGFFGDKIANEYLIPYNEKLWKRPLDKMAADWVFTPGRLPFPKLDDMINSAAGIPNVGYNEQSFFYYPKRGGIQALYNSLLNIVKDLGGQLIAGEKVSKVERKRNKLYEINDTIKTNNVINTLPLPEILRCIGDSAEMNRLSDKFDWNRVVIVGLALSRKTPDQIAVYVPDPTVIFHRYTWMSSLIRPKKRDKSNIIAEITIPKNDNPDLHRIVDKTIKGLADLEVISDEEQVIFSKAWLNEYGYPIYSIDHKETRDLAMALLNEFGIKSVGRWGSWHYWNTDMVFNAVLRLND